MCQLKQIFLFLNRTQAERVCIISIMLKMEQKNKVGNLMTFIIPFHSIMQSAELDAELDEGKSKCIL